MFNECKGKTAVTGHAQWYRRLPGDYGLLNCILEVEHDRADCVPELALLSDTGQVDI